jgi:hypothetical protein
MYKPLAKFGNGKTTISRIESLAREQTEKSINTLISIRDQKDCPPNVRRQAALDLIYLGWGKPREAHIVEDVQGRSLMKIVHEIVHVNESKADLEQEDLVVDYRELKQANGGNGNGGNGSNGNGHAR